MTQIKTLCYALYMICSKCGNEVEKYAFRKLCRLCYNAKMAQYMLARYHRRRNEWIIKLGGVCVDCGSAEELEFDHVVASDKTYNVGKILSGWSEAKVAAEMAKCVLRCNSCHTAKSIREGDITTVEHGGGISGKKNCKCTPCRLKRNEYMRAWKQSHK